MAVKIFKAKIAEKLLITKDTYLLRIPFDGGIEFEAGQFVNILVAPNVRRSYSIATPPSVIDRIELIGDTVVGGPGSLFFDRVKVGDDVEFLAPLGQFTYKEAENPAYFFATGTGLVPFISMITHALETLNTTRQIKLFLGFRHQETIFYKEYFEKLAQKFPNFEFILTLSQPDDLWEGNRGRINEHYEKIVGQNPSVHAYICGSQDMINDVNQKLLNLGVPPENVFYEKYY